MRPRLLRATLGICVLATMTAFAPATAGAWWSPWMTSKLIAYDPPGDPTPESRAAADVDGRWVVYHSSGNVYAYDLRTGVKRTVSAATSGQQYPAVSGDWVVYQDSRHGNYEIYAYNLSTSIERRLTSRAGGQRLPDISGTKVVYWDDVADDIYLYDLNQGTEKLLPTGAGESDYPSISGNRVAYRHDLEIYVMDLTTNTTRRLTNDSRTDRRVDIDGTVVAWEHSNATNYDIQCVDLMGGSTKTVSAGNWDQENPRVDGYRVVYEDNDDGFNDWNVGIYDLKLGLATTLTSATHKDAEPVIDGNNIAWTSDYGGDNDLALGRLAGTVLTARVSSAIVSYGSTVKVTGTLTDNDAMAGGRLVKIDKSTNGGHTWAYVGSATTDSAGNYSYTTPGNQRKTWYRARFDGKEYRWGTSRRIDLFSSLSASVAVTPKVSLTRPKTKSSTYDEDVRFTVWGYLKPKHTAGTRPVQIQIYKKINGKYRYKRTYDATVSDYGTYSKYKVKVRLTSPGRWRMRALYVETSTNAKTYSSYKYITVE